MKREGSSFWSKRQHFSSLFCLFQERCVIVEYDLNITNRWNSHSLILINQCKSHLLILIHNTLATFVAVLPKPKNIPVFRFRSGSADDEDLAGGDTADVGYAPSHFLISCPALFILSVSCVKRITCSIYTTAS